MEKVRANITVSGIVQMVGFRYHTFSQATGLNINGWVRNKADGSVEIMAEGRKEDVEELIQWCHKGPPSAAVKKVNCSWLDYKGDQKDFSISI